MSLAKPASAAAGDAGFSSQLVAKLTAAISCVLNLRSVMTPDPSGTQGTPGSSGQSLALAQKDSGKPQSAILPGSR